MNFTSNSILLLTLILCFTLIPNVDAYWVNGVEIIPPGYVEPTTEPSVDYSIHISDPNAYGEIILSENEFKLYQGNPIIFPIIVEMNNFIHKPTLEIIYNDIKIQSIDLFSNGDFFQSIIGLNDNWESGVYTINLIQQENILDTVSFVINRDNEDVIEKTIFESVFQTTEPFISITPSVISIDKHYFGTLSVLGSINDSRTGHPIILEIVGPDGNPRHDSGLVTSDGEFMISILVDKHWIDGKYIINAKYLDGEQLSTFFTVENSLQSALLKEEKLIGSFSVSSEISHDYTILGISGNVDTDEPNMILQITKEDIIMFEDTLSLNDQSFETSTVLYDYTLNTPWAFGIIKFLD